MTRRERADIRRKLRAAAKARWQRYRDEKKASQSAVETASPPATKTAVEVVIPPKSSSQAPRLPRLVAAIDLAAMERQAGQAISAKGRGYSSQKSRFELESLSKNTATVRVQEI